MRAITATLYLIACLLIMLLAGCTAAGAAGAFPTGTYTAEYVGQELALTFNEDGTYTAVLGGAPFASGTYTLRDGKITFGADAPCSFEAVYDWSAGADSLTLEASAYDKCSPRSKLFNWKTFARS